MINHQTLLTDAKCTPAPTTCREAIVWAAVYVCVMSSKSHQKERTGSHFALPCPSCAVKMPQRSVSLALDRRPSRQIDARTVALEAWQRRGDRFAR
eukprot:991986-Rhodomonas_salina.1